MQRVINLQVEQAKAPTMAPFFFCGVGGGVVVDEGNQSRETAVLNYNICINIEYAELGWLAGIGMHSLLYVEASELRFVKIPFKFEGLQYRNKIK